MKNNMKSLLRMAIVCLAFVVLAGCVPPGLSNQPAAVSVAPAGLAAAKYDDSGWKVLSDDNGTIAYQIPSDRMPAIAVGDQVVHNGNELREVVAIVDKTEDSLVIHTIAGNLAKLFPADSTLTIDTKTMTATVDYAVSGRSAAASYTLPVVLKQVRETKPDGTEAVLYDRSAARSITFIDYANSCPFNVDQTFSQTIFDKSGKGVEQVDNSKTEYDGDVKLTMEEKVKLALNFNLRLYLNYDAGVTMVQHSTVVRWWLITWHQTTVVWYEAVAWSTLKKELKVSVSGNSLYSATAKLSCHGKFNSVCSVSLPFSYAASFDVGGIPVDVAYTPSLDINAKGEGNFTTSIGASLTIDGEYGSRYDDSGWQDINTCVPTPGFIKPEINGVASMSVVPQMKNQLRVGIGYSNTGVYGTFTLTPYVSLEASAGLQPEERKWNIYCGAKGAVGVKAMLLGYSFPELSKQIFDLKKDISSGTF